jgi:hypothetical protein
MQPLLGGGGAGGEGGDGGNGGGSGGAQMFTVHMMPRSVHVHVLHPSGDGNQSPRLYSLGCGSGGGAGST